jgi:hypothetical protein
VHTYAEYGHVSILHMGNGFTSWYDVANCHILNIHDMHENMQENMHNNMQNQMQNMLNNRLKNTQNMSNDMHINLQSQM